MEFSKEITTILDYLCQKFGIVIDWTSENITPYLKDLCTRYISYELLTSIAWMAIMITVTIIIGIILSIMHKKAINIKYDDGYTETYFAAILWVAFIIISLTTICVIGVQIFDIIECNTIPEKLIMEYLNHLKNIANQY